MRILVGVFVMVLAGGGVAEDRGSVFGRWASDGSIIEIGEVDGSLGAVVVARSAPR